jgi:hypothetical protein
MVMKGRLPPHGCRNSDDVRAQRRSWFESLNANVNASTMLVRVHWTDSKAERCEELPEEDLTFQPENRTRARNKGKHLTGEMLNA